MATKEKTPKTIVHAPPVLTFYWPRFTEMRFGNRFAFDSGLQIREGVAEDGVGSQFYILGAPGFKRRRGKMPSAIELSKDGKTAPHVVGDKLQRADIDESTDELKFVREQRPGFGLRFFRSGLIPIGEGRNRGTQQDFSKIIQSGRRFRDHCVFPISPQDGRIIAQGIDDPDLADLTGNARVFSIDPTGEIRGLPGVPKSLDMGVEVEFGGAVFFGDVDSVLEVHELRRNGEWKIIDVTHDAPSQKLFMDHLEARRKQREEAKRAFKATLSGAARATGRPPIDAE
jgi:hypothetical protein